MDMKKDSEKMIDSAISGSTEEIGDVDLYEIAARAEALGTEDAHVMDKVQDDEDTKEIGTVELFELAAENSEPTFTPAPEDIFCIVQPEEDAANYPDGFDVAEDLFRDSSENTPEDIFPISDEYDTVFSDSVDEEDYYSEDDEDEAYSEDDEDEEYSEDDEDEEYSEGDEDEEYSEDDEDEEYSKDDEDEEYSEDDEDEEYSEDDEDEEYSGDDEDEEYSEDDEDEEYSEDDEDEEYSGDDEDEEYSEDDEDDEESEDDEDEEYSGDDEDEEDSENSKKLSAGVFGEADWLKDADGIPLANDVFAAPDSVDVHLNEDLIDIYAVASNVDDLPEMEKHGTLYYWAKRKTAAGWVKFGLKCVAVIVLIFVVSGVLYFNGLLNLIDYKAADDFEIYDSISETDYDEGEDIVYSNPESYIETTTIEGFTESMIDIPKKDVLNILLIGTDIRGGTYDERGNTDSMILISVNTRDKNIKITSFMRDMYVYIPDRQWARLNVAYAYGGPQLLFDTLKKNFNVDVDLYVRVNFANFRKIVNHVGGVDIELSEAEAKYMNDNSEKYKTKPVEPGMQHLDGAQALSYARCRKIDSDFNRTKRQRTVILALVDEIKHSSPGELNSLLNVFLPMIQTNMSKMQILSLMVDGTKYLNNEIETMNVPIKNSWRSETINKRSVLCPNFELNKTAIVAHIYSTYHLDVDKTKYQSFSIPN